MKLIQLLDTISYRLLQGDLEQDITVFHNDSRKMKPGGLFMCINGYERDGHQYIGAAIQNGATAIIVTKEVTMVEGITYVLVEGDQRIVQGKIARALHGDPSRQLCVIGITGTKGKTTTALMIKAILEAGGQRVGIIGTNGTYINGIYEPTDNTTPDSVELMPIMAKMVAAHCDTCVMEVSSLAVKQHRIYGIDFDYGVFTNLSPDHISEREHPTFEDYKESKKRFFDDCQVALMNRDDPYCDDMMDGLTCPIYTYGLHIQADLVGEDVRLYREGKHMGITMHTHGMIEADVKVDIPGEVNAYNALVSMMIARLRGIDDACVNQALSTIQIPGRGQIMDVSDDYTVIIDYAHNGASFESIISTVERYHPRHITCVYGCGGKRPKIRRLECGETAGRHGVTSILTMDNPRGEKVIEICEDIIEALAPYGVSYKVVIDRREAIFYALDHAQPGDVVLLLGKGHEDYQIGEDGITRHFSEVEVLKEYKALKSKK